MTQRRHRLGLWKPANAGFLSRWTFLALLLFVSILGCGCAAGSGPARFRPKVSFGFHFDFLSCEASGVSVRCEPERRIRSDVWVDWLDRRWGWRSARFEGGTLPRELACSDQVLWFLFHWDGSEMVWLSGERDVRKWRGCTQPEPYQNFYFPLTAGPSNPWIPYKAAKGAEFVAVRFVPFYPDDQRPITNLPVVLLSTSGQEELLGTTDATGRIVLSKEVLKKKDGMYLLVNPPDEFDRVAVPLKDVLEKAGSYFREVFLVSVGFY